MIRRIEGRDRERLPDSAVADESVLVVTASDRRIPLHQDPNITACPNTFHSFPDGTEYALGFVGDDQHMGGMVRLKLVWIVGGKAHGIAFVAQF